MNTLLALARADVLERVRRYGFLVLTGLVLWLGYGAYQGSVHVRLVDFVGRWNSAWAGGMMAMIANTFLSLFGFWFVRNAVDRDERTGVGPILATTPLTRAAYVVGKALSHFTVLALMALLLFASAVVIQLLRGGLGPVVPLDYLGPYVFVVLPALALTAACAILFETTPGLRGAFRLPLGTRGVAALAALPAAVLVALVWLSLADGESALPAVAGSLGALLLGVPIYWRLTRKR